MQLRCKRLPSGPAYDALARLGALDAADAKVLATYITQLEAKVDKTEDARLKLLRRWRTERDERLKLLLQRQIASRAYARTRACIPRVREHANTSAESEGVPSGTGDGLGGLEAD